MPARHGCGNLLRTFGHQLSRFPQEDRRMPTYENITRRSMMALLASAAFSIGDATAQSAAATPVKVYKESTCGCCAIWARHMSAAGFSVETIDVPDVNRIKTQFGIPPRLATCHTAEVGGYLVEGHVPATVVRRLLAERPWGARRGCPRDAGRFAGHGGRVARDLLRIPFRTSHRLERLCAVPRRSRGLIRTPHDPCTNYLRALWVRLGRPPMRA